MTFADSTVTRNCLIELKRAVNNLEVAMDLIDSIPATKHEEIVSRFETMELWLNRVQMYQELLRLTVQWSGKFSKRN